MQPAPSSQPEPTSSDTPAVVWVASTTFPSRDRAEHVAKLAIDQGLAACAQVGQPISSVYRWQGEVHHDTEVPLVFKTTQAALAPLAHLVHHHHPYDVPQWLAWPTDPMGAYPQYAQWCQEQTLL